METMVPKLVAEDIPLLNSLLTDVFPGIQYTANEREKLRKEIQQICAERYLVYGEGGELGGAWVDKVRRGAVARAWGSWLSEPGFES